MSEASIELVLDEELLDAVLVKLVLHLRKRSVHLVLWRLVQFLVLIVPSLPPILLLRRWLYKPLMLVKVIILFVLMRDGSILRADRKVSEIILKREFSLHDMIRAPQTREGLLMACRLIQVLILHPMILDTITRFFDVVVAVPIIGTIEMPFGKLD